MINPGPIDTAVFAGNEEFKNQMVAQIPMGRLGLPEEIATTALFLASADGGVITGSEIYVDGGMAQI